MDDYSEKAWAFDFVARKWKLNLRPSFDIRPLAHILIANISNSLPGHDFLVRAVMLSIHILNVFLLAKLAHRLTGSLFVAVISGAYFLMPVFGNEAILWFATSVPNTMSVALLLIGFHCLLSCNDPKKDLRLLIFGIGAWVLMVLHYEVGLFTLVLLPILMDMVYGREGRADWRVWVLALAGAFAPIGFYLQLIERTSPSVAARGGTTLNLAFILSHRIPEVFLNTKWLVTNFGIYGPLRDAFDLGWHEWHVVRDGRTIVTCFLIMILLAIVTFPAQRDRTPSATCLLKLAVVGLAWTILCFVPIILVKSQVVEVRTLYLPSAGVALVLAALFGLVAHLLEPTRQLWMRAMLLATGVVVFSSSFVMAGLVRTYQLRWQTDEQQVAEIGPILTSLASSHPIWFLPVALDQHTVSAYWGRATALDAYLFGVFEHEWSASAAVRLQFGSRNFHVVTAHHWETLHLTSVRRSGESISEIVVQGEAIPTERLVAFTYRQGETILLNHIEIDDPDTDVSAVVDLPLVSQLSGTGLKIEKARFQLEHPH